MPYKLPVDLSLGEKAVSVRIVFLSAFGIKPTFNFVLDIDGLPLQYNKLTPAFINFSFL